MTSPHDTPASSQGRTIPDPGFAGDDGSVPEPLAQALAEYARDPESGYVPALAALCGSRLLVPVVAVAAETEPGEHGLEQEKTSDMAAVLMRGADGRTGLLAFTSTRSLAAWNPDGRPVPVPAATAALSAVQDGAEALVVDVAGPALLVVEGEHLDALARGYRLVRLADDDGADDDDYDGGGWAWIAAAE